MAKKVYVGNLPFAVDNEELKKIFGKFGEIEEAVVISDRFSGRSKGFGFVTFKKDGDADKAVSEMDGTDVQGRNVKVNEARARDSDKD